MPAGVAPSPSRLSVRTPPRPSAAWNVSLFMVRVPFGVTIARMAEAFSVTVFIFGGLVLRSIHSTEETNGPRPVSGTVRPCARGPGSAEAPNLAVQSFGQFAQGGTGVLWAGWLY